MSKPSRPRAPWGTAATYFDEHVYIVQTACLIWPYGLSDTGYGKFYVDGRVCYTHRLSCLAWNGPASPGMDAAHDPGCPRSCFNGAHLRWDTRQGNLHDMVEDGTVSNGERRWNAVLTESDVLEIRRCYDAGGVSQSQLGATYGVTQTAISKIIRRTNWHHI
jgi:hypothetical protein